MAVIRGFVGKVLDHLLTMKLRSIGIYEKEQLNGFIMLASMFLHKFLESFTSFTNVFCSLFYITLSLKAINFHFILRFSGMQIKAALHLKPI